jgi:methylmalonyl-CoA mutase C-terminal domain/subunit
MPRARVLMAKVGLDGHDRGAKVISRLLRDRGYEVLYTGLRQQPAVVVHTAEQEDVQVIGLSILSGAHLSLAEAVLRELRERSLDEEIDVIVGGTIPPRDVARLREVGAAAVFGVGSTLQEIQDWFQEHHG